MIEVQNNHVYAYGTIGEAYTGEEFAAVLRRAEQHGSPVVHLHTLGGSVYDGLLMINAVKASKRPVTVIVEGVAASMGACFMLSASKVKAAANAMIMVHSASLWGGGNAKELEAQSDMLKKTDAALRTSFSERGIETTTIDSWFDGTDHWFTADEALAANIVDEVVAQVVEARLSKPLQSVELLHITASLEKTLSNHKTMLNISELLGLPTTASENEIKAAIEALNADAAKAREYCRKSIEAQISAALDAGKIKADQKASLQDYGDKMGADALRSLLDGMEARQTLRDQIVPGKKGGAKKYDDYTHDELLQMRADDPAKFKELLDAKYSE